MNKILKGVLIGALGACFILWAVSHKKALEIRFQVGVRYFEFISEFSCLRLSWSDWEMPVPFGSEPIPTPLVEFDPCELVPVSKSRFLGPFSFHEPSFLGAFSASTQTMENKIPKRFIRAPKQPDFDQGLISSPATRYYVSPHICIPIWVALLPLIVLVAFVTRNPRSKIT